VGDSASISPKKHFIVAPSSAGRYSPLEQQPQNELKLEQIQTQMTQKLMLRAKVHARALRVARKSKSVPVHGRMCFLISSSSSIRGPLLTLAPSGQSYSLLWVMKKLENGRPPRFLGRFLDSRASPPQFLRRPADAGQKGPYF
jgi:hypothetical protein